MWSCRRSKNPVWTCLGETAEGILVHIELQSRNDASMPLRMAEYGLRILRRAGRYPRQVLLYVGEAPLRMESELRASDDVVYRYRTVDIRELDGDQLLNSDGLGDNVVAILTRVSEHRAAIRRILTRIAGVAAEERRAALAQLMILAGLRHLGEIVEEEAKQVPITESILDHEVLGREFKKGELIILRRVIEKRFGPIPAWAEERLASRSATELEDLSLRVLDAKSLEDLLR